MEATGSLTLYVYNDKCFSFILREIDGRKKRIFTEDLKRREKIKEEGREEGGDLMNVPGKDDKIMLTLLILEGGVVFTMISLP